MLKAHHTVIRTLTLIMMFGCGSIAIFFLNPPAAQAQQVERPRRPQGPVAGPVIPLPRGQGEMNEQQQAENTKSSTVSKRWEYCTVTYIGSVLRGKDYIQLVKIRYFPNTVEQVEGESLEDARANAFTKLGEEGWELVGIEDNDSSAYTIFYFKRPK